MFRERETEKETQRGTERANKTKKESETKGTYPKFFKRERETLRANRRFEAAPPTLDF